jgi:tetratricopeptide (TPR) repeat protein
MNWFHRKMKLSTFADNAMRKSHRIVDSVNTFRAGNNYLVGDEFLYRGASAAAKVAFGKAKRALSNRDVQAAIEHYLAAIEDEHDWWAPHYELGVVFYSLGQIDRAASLFALSIGQPHTITSPSVIKTRGITTRPFVCYLNTSNLIPLIQTATSRLERSTRARGTPTGKPMRMRPH